MKNWKSLKPILLLLAMTLSVHAIFAQSQAPQTSSVPGSQKSGIPVNKAAEAEPPKVLMSGPERQSLSAHDGGEPQSRGGDKKSNLVGACAAAVEDLKATRELAEALGEENGALKRELETKKRTVDLLNELNDTRKREADALRETVAAKNEAIAAKDAVIASQDKLMEALKNKKSSPWKRLGDVLIGAAVFAILK